MKTKSIILTFFLCLCAFSGFAQCTNGEGFSIQVFQEFVDGDLTDEVMFNQGDLLQVEQVGEQYRICSDRLISIRVPQEQLYNSNVINPNNTSNLLDAMGFFHLNNAWNFLGNSSSWNNIALGNSAPNGIEFKTNWITTQNESNPRIQVNATTSPPMLEFSLSSSGKYDPLATDAYALTNGLFQMALELAMIEEGKTRSEEEGIDWAFGNFFAHRYMVTNQFVESNETLIFKKGGIGNDKFKTLSLSLNQLEANYGDLYNYYKGSAFGNKVGQAKSELLSAALWDMAQIWGLYDIINNNGSLESGFVKMEQLIIGSLLKMDQSVVSQAAAAVILFNDIEDGSGDNQYGITDYDQCLMYYLFRKIYGDKFTDFVGAYGDIYISDFIDDQGVESHTQDVFNSPHVWNRHDQDFIREHEFVYSTLSPELPQNVNYVHVQLNSTDCVIPGTGEFSNMTLKVYYNIFGFGSKWAPDDVNGNPVTNDWNNLSVHNDPYGDLIGTYKFSDGKFYDDEGQEYDNDLKVQIQDNGDHVVLSIPYYVPNLFTTPLKGGVKRYMIGLFARFVQDQGVADVNAFDPITNAETTNIANNVRNNNNLALKKSIITYYESVGGTSSNPHGPGNVMHTPGIIKPNDPDPNNGPTTKLTIDPAPHDPDPAMVDPSAPVRPVFNDFENIGTVILVLDPQYFQAWTANGQLGHGFTVNGDNEIEVHGRNFSLEGLPVPPVDDYNVIAVKFQPFDLTAGVRTGFDLTEWSPSNSKLGSVHVEVRSDQSYPSTPRFVEVKDVADNVMLYPNPSNGDFISLESESLISEVQIFSFEGQMVKRVADVSTTEHQMDITDLSRGIYFIQVTTEAGVTETKRFIRM